MRNKEDQLHHAKCPACATEFKIDCGAFFNFMKLASWLKSSPIPKRFRPKEKRWRDRLILVDKKRAE